MKVTSDNVKTALIVAGVGFAAYVAYRAYRVAGGIKDSIGENLSAVGDAITGTIDDVSAVVKNPSIGVDYYKEWVSDFWRTEDSSGENYPEAGPIRAAQNAAIGEAIKVRYTDPGATFEQLSDPIKPFYNYGPAPSFGSDSVLGSMPAPYSPDSFQGLAGPDIILTYQIDQP
jgi:hypothetical protein